MKILLLSDLRLPTRLDYAGHGLGRSIARLAEGLAEKGHTVFVSATPGSYVKGGTALISNHRDEKLRAEQLLEDSRVLGAFDVVVDGSHQFDLARLAPHLPIVCKCVDMENTGPYNRVYLYKYFAVEQGHPTDPVVWEYIDIDSVPFSNRPRGTDILYVGLLRDPKYVIEFSKYYNEGYVTAIHEATRLSPFFEGIVQSGAMPPAELYRLMGLHMATLNFWPPSASVYESLAAGTPVLNTDVTMELPEEVAMTTPNIQELAFFADVVTSCKPQVCRQWVADSRNKATHVRQWEQLLEKAANGEKW